MSLKKMRKYIERDDVKKLSKWLAANRRDIDGKVSRDGKTGLHLASKLGHEDCLQRLLREGASVEVRDRKGNYPLHYAIKFCLKRDGFNGLKGSLVDPLLRRMPHDGCLNEENSSGTTCRHLLRGLEIKKQLADQEPSSSGNSSSSDPEESWAEKLADADYEDRVESRLEMDQNSDFVNAYRENYDQWAERIFTEFLRRKNVKLKAEKKQKKSQPNQKESAFQLKAEPLKLPQPSKRENFAHEKHRSLFVKTKITVDDLPFTEDSSSDEIMSVILTGKGNEAEPKTKIREAIRKWHPDKFTQMCGQFIVESQRDQVMKIVTKVSQALLNYGKT